MRLRYKFGIFIAFILIIAIASLSYFLLDNMWQIMFNNMREQCSSILAGFRSVLQKNFDSPLVIKDYISAMEKQAIGKGKGVEYIEFISIKGDKFASGVKDIVVPASKDDMALIRSKINGIKWDVVRVHKNGRDIVCYEFRSKVYLNIAGVKRLFGVMKLGYNAAILDNNIKNAQRTIIFLLVVVIVVAVVLSNVLLKFLIIPIRKLTQMVAIVGKGNLDVHIDVRPKVKAIFYKLIGKKPPEYPADEIGILSANFNEMVKGLKEKLHMEKFVSKSTVQMIKQTVGQKGVVRRGGKREEITLLFSDVRGFTSMSEKLPPEKVVDILNEYLDLQANIIKKNGVDVDKFVGDEVMAICKGSDMVLNAIRAAVEIKKTIKKLNEDREAKGDVPINVGIGINKGVAVTGSIGSEDRMDYTAIGDSVNLAARLCSYANPGEIIITLSSLKGLKRQVKYEKMDPIRVKGKEKPIEVCRILDIV